MSDTKKPDLTPINVSPDNYVGDPNNGVFIDWDSEFMQKGLAPPMEASEKGDPSVLFGQVTGKGLKKAGVPGGVDPKVPFYVKDAHHAGGMDGGYKPGIQGEYPHAGSDATYAARPAAPTGQGSPAPQGIPPAMMARQMPFADQLAPMMAQMQAAKGKPAPEGVPPAAMAAQPAPENIPPAKKCADESEYAAKMSAIAPWIDWEGLHALMSGSADAHGRGHGRPNFEYEDEPEEKKDDSKAEKSLSRLHALRDQLRKAGGHKYRSRKRVGKRWVYEYDEPKGSGQAKPAADSKDPVRGSINQLVAAPSNVTASAVVTNVNDLLKQAPKKDASPEEKKAYLDRLQAVEKQLENAQSTLERQIKDRKTADRPRRNAKAAQKVLASGQAKIAAAKKEMAAAPAPKEEKASEPKKEEAPAVTGDKKQDGAHDKLVSGFLDSNRSKLNKFHNNLMNMVDAAWENKSKRASTVDALERAAAASKDAAKKSKYDDQAKVLTDNAASFEKEAASLKSGKDPAKEATDYAQDKVKADEKRDQDIASGEKKQESKSPKQALTTAQEAVQRKLAAAKQKNFGELKTKKELDAAMASIKPAIDEALSKNPGMSFLALTGLERESYNNAKARLQNHIDKYVKAQRKKASKTEKSMNTYTETDQYGRVLRKGGLHSFSYTAEDAKLPDEYLYDYLCAFVCEAYEHEAREAEHKPLKAEDQLMHMSKMILSELVQTIPKNSNLMRACKKHSCNVQSIAKILIDKGLHRPKADSDWTDDTESHRAMGVEVMAYSMDYATPEVDPYGRPGLTLHKAETEEAAHLIKEDTRNPYEDLRERRDAFQKSLWKGHIDETAKATVSGDCPVHAGPDHTKSMNLSNPMLPCTCG